jgi:hypothetical protein
MDNDPYERFLGNDPKPKLWLSVVSHITMLIVALALFYASYKCFVSGHRVQADWLKRPHAIPPSSRNFGPGIYLDLVAAGLLALGGLLLLAATVNVSRLSNWFAPPRATLWEPLVGDTRHRSYRIGRRY